MRIGFVTMFSWRPHVEHMHYLAKHLRKAGHETFFLNCRGSLSTCYNLLAKNGVKAIECSKCVAGSLFSYESDNVTFLKPELTTELGRERLSELSRSSAYTLTRIEDPKDMRAPEVLAIQELLHQPIQVVYENTRQWLQANRLDHVMAFNGRMDVTRAVIEACTDAGTPFTCMERTWFGNGIHLYPGANCLSLTEMDRLVRQYRDKPLTAAQASHAASRIVSRFKKQSHLEWRAYNTASEAIDWPVPHSAAKVLILPSSRNERLSHPDWTSSWDDDAALFKVVALRLGVPLDSCVLRGHPGWAESLNKVGGERIEAYYLKWCKENGVHYIPGSAKADTSHLIRQADVIVLNGSSAAFEAGLMGKKIVTVGKCQYQSAGIAAAITSDDELRRFGVNSLAQTPAETVKKTLRFVYTYAHRYALFRDSIRALKTTSFRYADDFDTDRLVRILTGHQIIPDDETFAADDAAEDALVARLLSHDYDGLEVDPLAAPIGATHETLSRRPLFSWVDGVRNLFVRGDLA